MTSKQLYHLIHNLKPDEKAKISLAFRFARQKRRAGYSILFERMLDCKEWSLANEHSLRGGDFANPVKYHQTREMLLDKIIRVLSNSENSAFSRSYIKKAVELDAIKLAKAAVQNNLEIYVSDQLFFKAMGLIRFCEDLKIFQSVELLPASLSSLKLRIKDACDLDLLLMDFYHELKALGLVSPSEWTHIANRILEQLLALEPGFPILEFKVSRLISRALFFSGKTRLAWEKQKELLSKIESSPVETSLLMQEISLLIQLSGDVGKGSEADYWTLKLGKIECGSPSEVRLRERLFIRNALIIADRFNRFGLCQKAIKVLNVNPELFSDRLKSTLIYSSAVIAHCNGYYSYGLKRIDELLSIPKKARPHLTWQPYLLRTIIINDNGGDVIPSYRATQRQIKKQELAFPGMVLKLLTVLSSKDAFSASLVKVQWENQFENLFKDSKEFDCTYYFDVTLWLKSRIAGKTMAALQGNGQSTSKEFLSAGFV